MPRFISAWYVRSICLAALVGVNPFISYADDPVNPKSVVKPGANDAPDQAQIDAMVAQLEHAQLTKREEARRSLMKAGKAAIPALAKAALSGKREMIEKSIDILAKLAQTGDAETKDAAKVTLQMLSESEQPSTADRAKLVLGSKPADGIQPFDGNKFPMPFGGGMGRSVSVSNVNGRRSVTVKEGAIETTVEELTNGKLHVVINGGKEPVEMIVKNKEELKKKSPEAFAIYEQNAGGAMQNFGNGFPIPPGFGNRAFGNQAAAPLPQGANPGQVDSNAMMLKHLQDLKQRFGADPMLQQMLDQQIQMIEKNQPAAK